MKIPLFLANFIAFRKGKKFGESLSSNSYPWPVLMDENMEEKKIVFPQYETKIESNISLTINHLRQRYDDKINKIRIKIDTKIAKEEQMNLPKNESKFETREKELETEFIDRKEKVNSYNPPVRKFSFKIWLLLALSSLAELPVTLPAYRSFLSEFELAVWIVSFMTGVGMVWIAHISACSFANFGYKHKFVELFKGTIFLVIAIVIAFFLTDARVSYINNSIRGLSYIEKLKSFIFLTNFALCMVPFLVSFTATLFYGEYREEAKNDRKRMKEANKKLEKLRKQLKKIREDIAKMEAKIKRIDELKKYKIEEQIQYGRVIINSFREGVITGYSSKNNKQLIPPQTYPGVLNKKMDEKNENNIQGKEDENKR